MNETRGASTKQRIIETAAELFHRHGVQATSVDDVLDASSTGKGQFYHYFKSKEDLVHEVLQHYIAHFKAYLPDQLNSISAFEDWLRGHITKHAEFDCRRACPIGSIGLELADNELIRQDVQLLFLQLKNALMVFFTRMNERRVLQADAETLADFVLSVLQGGALVGKVNRHTAPFERAVESAIAYIRSLQR